MSAVQDLLVVGCTAFDSADYRICEETADRGKFSALEFRPGVSNIYLRLAFISCHLLLNLELLWSFPFVE